MAKDTFTRQEVARLLASQIAIIAVLFEELLDSGDVAPLNSPGNKRGRAQYLSLTLTMVYLHALKAGLAAPCLLR